MVQFVGEVWKDIFLSSNPQTQYKFEQGFCISKKNKHVISPIDLLIVTGVGKQNSHRRKARW
jgi:hypothetical protein